MVKRLPLPRLASILVGAFLVACGWKTDGLARIDQLYPEVAADAGTTGPVDLGNPDCHGLQGTWAVELLQSGTIQPTGETWRIDITDLFLASSNASFDLTFCNENVGIVTPNGPTTLGETVIPSALQTVLASQPISIPLPGDGTFQASGTLWLWGLQNMTNPATDSLPTSPSDPRVWDEDKDTNPGVTLTIVNPPGNRYMVRRATWSFAQGTPTLDNAWLTGSLSALIQESVLGATNNLLLNDPPITPDDSRSRYIARCVGSTFSCNSLWQNYAAIFQGAPK